MHAAFFVVLLCCLPSYLCSMITFMSSWPGRLFSSDIPDLRFSIAFERALVTVEVLKNGSVETAFSELLYPDNDNQICLSDIDLLVLPYSDRYVVFDVRVTVQEQNVYSSDHVGVIDTQTVSASVVTCKAIVKNMTAADFCNWSVNLVCADSPTALPSIRNMRMSLCIILFEIVMREEPRLWRGSLPLILCLNDGSLCLRNYFQASMIPLKSGAFSDAPPMRPPSMSGFENSSGALLALQLPP